MPRKYRPPATKRRKERKTNIPYEVHPQEPATGGRTVGVAEEDAEAAVGQAHAAVTLKAEPTAVELRRSGERHVNRDYSYVRGEVVRIAIIVGFLIISLIVTSFFR